jgi:crotonobetainyl-CoA:carnitine CoA-transferase CaiB-like acyl-CoA transferase
MIPLLENVRVLELSAIVMGPFAGQILADLGADVVKVEPLEGDMARASHPQAAGMGALYVNNNRNKKSIAIDAKSAQGRAVLERLIARSDVLLHNMRTEAVERLGLGFSAAAAINPQLIYCAAVGFGGRGRYRHQPAFDDVIQAASGLAALASPNEPRFMPTILADKIGALYAVYGILAALLRRARGHRGAIRVEVPMFEALTAFVLNEHLAGATFEREGGVGYSRVLSPDRRPYRTRDGWIAVLPYTDKQWRCFLVEVGKPRILDEPWFGDSVGRQAHVNELYGIVADVLPERDTASWLETFLRLDIPCSRINRLEDLLRDPHLADVGFFDVGSNYPDEILRMLPQPVVFDGLARCDDRPPPALGADTRVVLRDAGYTDEQVDAILQGGVVREANSR